MTAIRQKRLPSAPNNSYLARHFHYLEISEMLNKRNRRMFNRQATIVVPEDVIKLLNAAKIEFILVGANAIGAWLNERRFTRDVDVIVYSQLRKAVRVLKKAYPSLLVQDLSAVIRFIDLSDKEAVIDLIKPLAELLKIVPDNTVPAGRTYRIPDLEMCLALKYAAMIAPNRNLRKQRMDESDFIGMVKENYEIIEKDKLLRLGNLVKSRGGREILRMVEDANADRPIRK